MIINTLHALLAGAAVLETKATTQPPSVPAHDRETHERFRQVVKDERSSDQAQVISDEPDGNKLS
jgi:hypothetical protein